MMAKKDKKNANTIQKKKHSSQMWYVITCIWFSVAIINFMLGYISIGAIFTAVGFLQLIVAIIQQIRERKK